MHLLSIKTITGRIRLCSGLHIGAGKDSVEIGGLDQPVIKDPLSGAPYIPGSSLKGKMRSLLETSVYVTKSAETRRAVAAGSPCDCGRKTCDICRLFGPHKAPKDCDPDLGPTRLLVRDAFLCAADLERFRNGRLPMEIKNENTINRLRGTAEHPRPLERVPAGVCFDMNIALRVYEGDTNELDACVLRGLKLLELDALGGGSSRGSGQIRFEELSMDGTPFDLSSITF